MFQLYPGTPSKSTIFTFFDDARRRIHERAQVVANYFPKLVELHNYAAANAVDQKMYNWKTLNDKVGLGWGGLLGVVVPPRSVKILPTHPHTAAMLGTRVRRHVRT